MQIIIDATGGTIDIDVIDQSLSLVINKLVPLGTTHFKWDRCSYCNRILKKAE